MKMRFVTRHSNTGNLLMMFTAANENNNILNDDLPFFMIVDNRKMALAVLKEILEGKLRCFKPMGKKFKRISEELATDEMFIEWKEVK